MSPAIACSRLTHHSQTPSQAVHGLEVSVYSMQPGAIDLTYVLGGNLDRLRIPVQLSPRRVDGLWQHTCFEAFVAVTGSAAYFEFNFSPSGEWAAYAFRDYRDGGAINDDKLDPKIVVRKEAETLELTAVIRMGRLPAVHPDAILRLGLSAVIEDIDGQLSYWALKHPPGKPDFHHSDNFTLEIQPPVDGVSAIAYTGKP
jgi:hypothetical protein